MRTWAIRQTTAARSSPAESSRSEIRRRSPLPRPRLPDREPDVRHFRFLEDIQVKNFSGIKIALASAALVLLGAASASAAELVTNGGFEGGNPPWTGFQLDDGIDGRMPHSGLLSLTLGNV